MQLYLSLPGMQGPVQAGPDSGWFPLLDYTHTIDVAISTGGGGGASGAPAHQPFQVERRPDVATTWLLERLHQGMVLPAVTVRACHADEVGSDCFLEVEMQNVVVRAVDSEAERISAPTERVAFDYTTIVWRHGDVTNSAGQVRVSTYNVAQSTFSTTGTTDPLGLSAELNEDTHPLFATGSDLVGDVTTQARADTILVTGTSHAVTLPGGGTGGGGAGAAQHDPLEVRTLTDRSTPDLLERMHRGQVTQEFSVAACTNGTQEPCDTTTIHDAFVSSLTYRGNQTEDWAFVYSQVTWQVQGQSFGWSVDTNTVA